VNKKWTAAILAVAIIVIVGLAAFWHHRRATARTIVDGTIECDEISVSSKIPGRIQKLLVDEGTLVKPGDSLVILESQELDAKVEQATAAYQSALAKVSQAGTAVTLQQLTYADQLKEAQAQYNARLEDVRQAQEGLNAAQAAYKTASDTYKRFKGLFEDGVIPEQTEQEIEYKYLAAKAQLGAAKSKVEQAHQGVVAAEGALQLAKDGSLQVNLRKQDLSAATQLAGAAHGQMNEAVAYHDETRIASPVSGYVSERVSNDGEMVAPGFPMLAIVRANDFKVKVYVDESKFGNLRLGRGIKVIIPALANQEFDGTLIRISQSADFATKRATNEQGSFDVRGIQLVIKLNDDSRFRNGMTARVVLYEGEN
jgi:HlyD family secretion protein